MQLLEEEVLPAAGTETLGDNQEILFHMNGCLAHIYSVVVSKCLNKSIQHNVIVPNGSLKWTATSTNPLQEVILSTLL